MATAAFPISAEDVGRRIATEQRRQNNGRIIPRIPAQIQKLAEETKVHVYNVGPWGYKRELGSAGTYFIPACPETQEYARMNPIPGVFGEMVIKDETAFEYRMEDGDAEHGGTSGGMYIANQVVGVGRMLSAAESLVPFGVFIGSQVGPNAKPTAAEIIEAKEQLALTADRLINEADTAERVGPKELEATLTDKHHWAGKFRNLKPGEHRWMREKVGSVAGNVTCPSCGTVSGAEIAMCATCKYILNEEKYTALKGKFAK